LIHSQWPIQTKMIVVLFEHTSIKSRHWPDGMHTSQYSVEQRSPNQIWWIQ